MRTERKIDVPFRTQQFVLLAAQTGSFHRAARSLGIDPSVVIRSIDRLEGELGAKIFARARNRFEVTGAGSHFIREIQKAVVHVERAWDLTRYHDRIQQGPLRIGYSPYVQSRAVSALERLRSSRTSHVLSKFESGISLSSDTTPRLVEAVLRGKIHAALGIQPWFDEAIVSRSLLKEAFCLCVSKNHPLARRSSVLAREMDDETVFFLPRDTHPGFYDRTIEYVDSTGASPKLREVLSLTHILEFVTHNFGVALLPQSASTASRTGVTFLPVTDKLLQVETAVFFRRDSENPRLQEFIEILDSQIAPPDGVR